MAANEYDVTLARLKAHEGHFRQVYTLRWGGLFLSALTIVIGSVMIFKGLQGSFDWAFQAPNSISAKLTNASPGIVFATIGMVLGFIVIRQKPIPFRTGSTESIEDDAVPKSFYRPKHINGPAPESPRRVRSSYEH
jgi:hypothetical protein